MTFSTGNMPVNKMVLTPGSDSLKISYMNCNKISEHARYQFTEELTSKLVNQSGLSAYRLMPLLAEVVIRLNILEGKEPTALPDSLTLP